MVKSEITRVNSDVLMSAYKKAMNQINRYSNITGVTNVHDVICDMVYTCKELRHKTDAQSKRLYVCYRDIVIGSYSLFLIKMYNQYAVAYKMDGNDLIHIPYEYFDTMVKNYDKTLGATFQSFMILSIHGYIKKYLNLDNLVRVPPNVKDFSVSYTELIKTDSDGGYIEYLSTPEEYEYDVDGKLEFAMSAIKSMPKTLQDLYNCIIVSENSKDANELYRELYPGIDNSTIRRKRETLKKMMNAQYKSYNKMNNIN